MKGLGVKNLFVFSPAFKVGETIGKNLEMFEDLDVMLKARDCDLHLIVINDNSPDNTKEVLEGFASSHPFMDVHNNKTNLGNAQNIINGYIRALGLANPDTDLVGCLDADGEHSPLAYRKHIEYIVNDGFDGIVGSIIYPHQGIGWGDLNMMRFHGWVQASMMGIGTPFYIQSPGFQLHRVKYLKEAVTNLYPRYIKFFEKEYGAMPKWGMHGLIDTLIAIAGGKLKSVYLECFGSPPNRDYKKLIDQNWAATIHEKALDAFANLLAVGKV